MRPLNDSSCHTQARLLNLRRTFGSCEFGVLTTSLCPGGILTFNPASRKIVMTCRLALNGPFIQNACFHIRQFPTHNQAPIGEACGGKTCHPLTQ
jgi:hypothetical protein